MAEEWEVTEEEPAPAEAPPRETRKKWQWLFQAAIFFAIVGLSAAAVAYLPIFKLERISVAGNSYVSAEDICRIAGVYKGQHMFQVETGAAAQKLKKDLRIEQASVRRVLPNGIVIEVEERRPVACVTWDFGFLELDRTGVALNAYPKRHMQTLPLLAGIEVHDIYIGDSVSDPQALLALEYLSGLDRGELAQIYELNLENPDYVVAYTTNAAEIRIGVLENLKQKAEITKVFLEELRTTKKAIPFLDIRYGKAVIPDIRSN